MQNFLVLKKFQNFAKKYPGFIYGQNEDLKSFGRIIFKAFMIVQTFIFIKKYLPIPVLSGNTWAAVLKIT